MASEQQSTPCSPATEAPAVREGVKRRGFASMSAERRRELASMGGKAAHREGRAHVFTSDEAQAAGRKGGKTISQDAKHMSRIGSVGGTTRWQRARQEGKDSAARPKPSPEAESETPTSRLAQSRTQSTSA